MNMGVVVPCYRQERFLGRILKGLMGEQQLEAEEENFLLGGLIGKLFGRELEAEGANYVQEQFLGGLLHKLSGGELESEQMEVQHSAPAGTPVHKRLRLARRFVRLAHAASRVAESFGSIDQIVGVTFLFFLRHLCGDTTDGFVMRKSASCH